MNNSKMLRLANESHGTKRQSAINNPPKHKNITENRAEIFKRFNYQFKIEATSIAS